MGLEDELASVPLTAGLDARVRRRLAEIGKQRRYAAGQTIVEEGTSGIAFYILLRGSARVEQHAETIGQIAAGEFFGELALIEDHPRSATVIATEDSDCLGITGWELKALIDEHPQVAVPIMRTLIKRLHRREAHAE